MTKTKKTASKQEAKRRKILVILSNRWNRSQKPKFLELDCDPEGNILKEVTLRSEPRERRFDEVWENDQGRTEFAACHKFSRKYTHKLQKPKG
jgi:hypothetical protein